MEAPHGLRIWNLEQEGPLRDEDAQMTGKGGLERLPGLVGQAMVRLSWGNWSSKGRGHAWEWRRLPGFQKGGRQGC